MSSLYQDSEKQHYKGAQPAAQAYEDPQDEKRRLEAAHTRRAHASRIATARDLIHGIALGLAEHGLSAETIHEAMHDMAGTASAFAASYIAEYDRAEEDSP